MDRSNKKLKILCKCITANTSAIWPNTTNQPTSKQEPHKIAYLLTKASKQKKRYERKSNRTQQKNKRGDRKVESNDSPEIADWRRQHTSPASLPGFSHGAQTQNKHFVD